MYSIILVHQGCESMNALDNWCHFLVMPATYVVSVCWFMSIRIIMSCYKLILTSCASICHINPSENSLIPLLKISYKAEATPSLLSPFCGLFMSFLKHFYLYAIPPYGWCIKPFCRQVIPGSHHIHSSRSKSGTQLPILCFIDYTPVCGFHLWH